LEEVVPFVNSQNALEKFNMDKNNKTSKPKFKIPAPFKVILITILGVIPIYFLISELTAPHIKGWKTYRSFMYNIRLQYPPDWSVKECVFSNNDTIYLIPDGEPDHPCSYSMALFIPKPGFSLALRTSEFGFFSSDTYQKALKNPYMNASFNKDAEVFKRENVRVSSYEAIKASGTRNNVEFNNYIVNINNKPLRIYYSKTPPTSKDYTDTADKIISTIKVGI
jgi:hypothetical protein